MQYYGVALMVLNASFNNISVISWRSVVLVEETGEPAENRQRKFTSPKRGSNSQRWW